MILVPIGGGSGPSAYWGRTSTTARQSARSAPAIYLRASRSPDCGTAVWPRKEMAQQWRGQSDTRWMADECDLHDQQRFSIRDYRQFLWILQRGGSVVRSSHGDRKAASHGLPSNAKPLV